MRTTRVESYTIPQRCRHRTTIAIGYSASSLEPSVLPAPRCGCRIPGDPWSRQTVTEPTYFDTAEPAGSRFVERRSCRRPTDGRSCSPSSASAGADNYALLTFRRCAPRMGSPRSMRPRLGQGAFRVAVTDAYGRECSPHPAGGCSSALERYCAHLAPTPIQAWKSTTCATASCCAVTSTASSYARAYATSRRRPPLIVVQATVVQYRHSDNGNEYRSGCTEARGVRCLRPDDPPNGKA